MTGGASGAIRAKIRAMTARSLTADDCAQLLRRPTVGAVASYLGSHPAYAGAFSGADFRRIGRLEVESRVRRARFSSLERLCRFGGIAGVRAADCVILEARVDALTAAVRNFAGGNTEPPDSMQYSDFIKERLGIDLDAAFGARSAREIADAVSDGELRAIIGRFPPDGGPVEATRTANELRSVRYAGFAAAADDEGGEAAKELREIIRGIVDLEDIVCAYRLKRYFGADRDAVLSSISREGGMSGSVREAIASAPDGDGVLAAARGDRRLSRLLEVESECAAVDDAPVRYAFTESLRLIRHSTSPAAAMISYLFLSRVECENVVKITEGKRYGLEPEEIEKMLILERGES